MVEDFKELALLDFDGTIIRGDSIKMFCKHCSKSKTSFLINYYIYCKILGFLSKQKLKHFTVGHFLKISRSNDLKGFNDLLEQSLFPDILDIIQKLKLSKRTIVVISASFEEIIGDFVSSRLQCMLIANTLSNNNLDVNYDQKLLSIKEFYPGYLIKVAYGNSPGDYAIMNEAEISLIRHADGTLEKWKN